MSNETSLDHARLENVKQLEGGAIRAACPACRAAGSDKSGNHLLIKSDGKFGCAANPKDEQHRKEIFKLAGLRQSSPAANGSAKQFVCAYDYLDANAQLAFQVVRYQNPKTFRQRRPDGNGGFIWNMASVELVLYRLPEIIRAVQNGNPIFICEGEKDCDAVKQRGFDATCNPGGAGKWLDSYTEILRGADVCIIADKDTKGRNHAQLVAGKLQNIAASVRVIELPDVDSRLVKDAHDFISAGGTAETILELVDAAPTWTPATAPDSSRVDDASEYLPSAAEAEQPAPGDDLPDLIDAADFLGAPIDPPAELVTGILHKGSKLAFGGSSKSFKTWCLLDLALSVATGANWIGRTTAQGRVLFVNFEIQPHAWQGRISAVAKAKGFAIGRGQITLWNLRGHAADFRQLVPRIIERCRLENFALIVLDPIYKLYGNTDENSAGNVALLLNALERLATETGAAIAFGAHFAKGNAGAKEAIDRISGSGVFARDPDSLLIFTKHETDDAFTVEPILRNFAPVQPFAVRWNFPLMELAADLDPTKLKQAGGRKPTYSPADLLAMLPPGGLANAAWLQKADGEGISKPTFYRLRKTLKISGEIHESAVSGNWQPLLKK